MSDSPLIIHSSGATSKKSVKRKADTSQSNVSKWSKSSELSTMTTTTASSSSSSNGSKMLMQRTSSYDALNICEHCAHDHMRSCCLYVYDDYSDINNYSMFKREVETPYWIRTRNDEFIQHIGGTTPKEFPLYSECDQEKIDKKAATNNVQSRAKTAQINTQQSSAVVYVRQYFWPLFLPEPFGSNPYDNYIRHHEISPQHPMAHSTPCVMRQVAIPVDSYYGKEALSKISNNPHSNNQPQVIETHSWVPWWMLR